MTNIKRDIQERIKAHDEVESSSIHPAYVMDCRGCDGAGEVRQDREAYPSEIASTGETTVSGWVICERCNGYGTVWAPPGWLEMTSGPADLPLTVDEEEAIRLLRERAEEHGDMDLGREAFDE